ncbi:PREDICTED: uncharacterized protein LOC109487350 [Branchiostoma belcheri]|uniref:Uncharacterized protein LOC109487350 n=1 Tax=Branchiostoma belcheri TaxID=7741 RepID=A0A6P5A0N1_BRABE|nr:PREDICTED: uncharacterized protein LOC109487350 [Branchiostoma belcheri]
MTSVHTAAEQSGAPAMSSPAAITKSRSFTSPNSVKGTKASLLRRLARPAVLLPVGVPLGLYNFAKLNPDAATAYYKRAFAWACARTMDFSEKKLTELKQEVFVGLREQDTGALQVLEIGVGGGNNFRYYPPGTSVVAVDPNPHFDQYLKENSDKYPDVKVTKFIVAGAEDMSAVAEGSVDAVVCTLVLCSVQDMDASIREVKRVLKPLTEILSSLLTDLRFKGTNKSEKKLTELKQEVFVGLREQDTGALQVLEIGVGGGSNFRYYPPGTSVIAVDPNPHFDQYLKENSDKYPDVKVTKFIVAGAEDMSAVAEGSVDAVVCTLVLCSVQDMDASIREVNRVLKPCLNGHQWPGARSPRGSTPGQLRAQKGTLPLVIVASACVHVSGGKFYYLEHVRHPSESRAQFVQDLLTPVFRVLSDGCHVNRETWKHLDGAGFTEVKYRIEGNLRPKFMTQILYGTATK